MELTGTVPRPTAAAAAPGKTPGNAGGNAKGIVLVGETGSRRGWRQILPWWPLAAVFLVYIAAAFVVPTLTPIATTDDWGYTRSVEILLQEGRLTVLPAVAATAVFQILWGALFGSVFGMTLGMMRVATLVMVALGGLALAALLRELGVRRSRAALGTAVYFFNPLNFGLTYSFMTDPYFTSLMIGSTLGYARGLRPGALDGRALLLGSAVAACAFLTRQQGALIPFAVVCYLLLARRLRFDWAGVRLVANVVAIPALTVVGYYLWLHFVNDVTDAQAGFLNEAGRRGWDGLWLLLRNLTFIELMYLGAFTVPIVVALIPAIRANYRSLTSRSWLLLVAWLAILEAGLIAYAGANRRWPYIPQFVGAGGIGPPDVTGSRPRLVDSTFFVWATVACAIAALLLAFFLSRGVSLPTSPERAAAALVLAVGFWQVIGVLPPSFHYIRRGYSLDRYLLPLLPVVICLLLWATRDLRLWQPVGWVLVGGLLAFSVAGTRDYLVYMNAVWSTANDAVAAGARYDNVDGGAAWDGYYLYTYARDSGITRARTRNGPWWSTFYGLATDSRYLVSSKPQPGYVIVWRRGYGAWLPNGDSPMYLLRRFGVPWPPKPAPPVPLPPP